MSAPWMRFVALRRGIGVRSPREACAPLGRQSGGARYQRDRDSMAKKKSTPKTTADKRRVTQDASADLFARIEADEQYRPSYEAEILARIYDGKARTAWKAVPDDAPDPDAPPDLARRGEGRVTDLDLLRGERLLEIVLDAFRAGDRALLDRLAEAATVLRGEPKTEQQRMAWYVDAFEHDAKRIREHHWLRENCSILVEAYAKYADATFGSLTAWELRDALMSVDVEHPKGGAGRTGATLAAARLAVRVEAFGAYADGKYKGGEPGSAAQESSMKKSLEYARQNAK